MAIKVKATREGYFGNQLRDIDEVFEIDNENQLGSWMERMDGKKNPAVDRVMKAQSAETMPLVDQTKVKAVVAEKKETAKKPAAKKPAAKKADSAVPAEEKTDNDLI